MKDPEILKERAKVQLLPDETLEKLYPKRVTIVEITLSDGSKRSKRIEAVRGTPDNPMTREEVTAKARDLMAPFLGTEKSSRLIEAILAIETNKDIRTLRPFLQPA
jgi:2-methylcitrate dehydratase PrpD